jgi:NADPH:quinone reductase-like Zn-dependent oxidoreductase
MRAAQINEYGGPEVLKVNNDTPKPSPASGEVLIEVQAAGVNPFDWKVRSGLARSWKELDFPATLGGDFAGTVVEVGEGVEGLAVGDEVFGQANALSGQGSYAEFVAVNSEAVAAKPKSSDWVTAAALPLASVSAYQALVEHANVQPGQKVLIHGGAGGIGSFAIQIAKQLGAHVTATAAAEDAEFVTSLGAGEVIDYKSQDFTTLVHDYDMAYDTVGGETFAKSHQVLRSGGIIVSMVEQPNEELQKQYGVTDIYQSSKVTHEKLAKIAEWVDSGAIKVQVDKTFPLEQAGEAQAYIEEGKHHGKVVLTIK